MNDIQLIDKDDRKAFVIEDDGQIVAEMEVTMTPSTMTVHHTNVDDKLKGQGVAQKLLASMVSYARGNGMLVVPLCPYVHAQFKRHPDQYSDIWKP